MDYATNKEAQASIVRLKEIYRILEYYDVAQYVSFDLSMLSRYNYYTGIFFLGLYLRKRRCRSQGRSIRQSAEALWQGCTVHRIRSGDR